MAFTGDAVETQAYNQAGIITRNSPSNAINADNFEDGLVVGVFTDFNGTNYIKPSGTITRWSGIPQFSHAQAMDSTGIDGDSIKTINIINFGYVSVIGTSTDTPTKYAPIYGVNATGKASTTATSATAVANTHFERVLGTDRDGNQIWEVCIKQYL